MRNKIQRTLFAILILTCILTLQVKADVKFNKEDFRKFVNREMKTFKVPGCAILVIKDDKTLMSEGFGCRDLEKKLKVTPETIFAIGSCSKAFTAFSAGLLADEKKLDLDKPIRQYYPGLRLKDPSVTEHVTMRDLLCHRTGLPSHNLVWFHTKLTREEILDRLHYLEFSRGFREVFQYNNLMYMTAGYVVGKVSGGTWERFVQERIFDPLGMKDSNFSVEDSKKSPNHALPYKFDLDGAKVIPKNYLDLPVKRVPFANIDAIGPAGSINSNIVDMEKWVRLHLNEGKLGKKQIISKNMLLQMHSPQMVTGGLFNKKSEVNPSEYCLGWGIITYRGYYRVQHSGGIDGFSALVVLVPRKGIGIVILTNMDSTRFHSVVANNLCDRLLGMKQIDFSKKIVDGIGKSMKLLKKKRDKVEKLLGEETKLIRPLKNYAGTYVNPAYGEVLVQSDGNQLKLSFNIIRDVPLKHLHYDTFMCWSDRPLNFMDLKANFLMDEKGDIDRVAMKLHLGIDDIVFRKVRKK